MRKGGELAPSLFYWSVFVDLTEFVSNPSVVESTCKQRVGFFGRLREGGSRDDVSTGAEFEAPDELIVDAPKRFSCFIRFHFESRIS